MARSGRRCGCRLSSCVAHRRDHLRMAMAGVEDRDAAGEVDVAAALDVPESRSSRRARQRPDRRWRRRAAWRRPAGLERCVARHGDLPSRQFRSQCERQIRDRGSRHYSAGKRPWNGASATESALAQRCGNGQIQPLRSPENWQLCRKIRLAGGHVRMAGTFVIAQGGGPTAVINQTMVGCRARNTQALIPAPACSGRAMACAASATEIMSSCRTCRKGTAAHRRHAERQPRLDPRQAGRRLLRQACWPV